MRFAQPVYFYGLFFVPVFILVLWLLAGYRRKMVQRFVDAGLEGTMARSFHPKRYLWQNIVLTMAVLLSVLALTRPQWGFEWREAKRQGLDIFVAVDVSKSMLTQDVRPDRLERTKLAIRDLLKKLKGDRIGLIAFAGDAFLVCPLTSDYSGFLLSLDELSTDTIPRGGTNIGQAIEEAMKGYEDVPSQFKVVVIITDGENWEGDPLQWAHSAADKGIRLYTVGIGTQDGELVRVPGEDGQMTFMKDEAGNVIMSRLNEKMLNDIAAVAGGVYIRSSGADTGLDYLYDVELSKMERRDIESEVEKRYHERFQWFLAPAFILLLIATMISSRRVEP